MDDRRVRKTKKALREALATLMLDKNLRHITVKELTDTADVHRATFYTHYQDVYDLYEQLETQIIEELASLLADEFISSYELWFKTLITYIYDNADVCRMFFAKMENNRFRSRIAKLFEESCLKFYQNLQQTSMLPTEAQYYVTYHIQGCISILGLWVDSNFSLSINEIVHLLISVDSNMDKLIAKIS